MGTAAWPRGDDLEAREGIMRDVLKLTTLLLSALLTPAATQSTLGFANIFGSGDETEEVSVTMGDDDDDDAGIDDVVEQLTSQLRSTIKSQIKASRVGASKLGASRLASLTELHIAVANNQYEVAEKVRSA